VYQYNATIQQVPALLLKPLFGWRSVDSFSAESSERLRPAANAQESG
jgi:hypothetical protein